MCASYCGHVEVVKLLLARGANVNFVTAGHNVRSTPAIEIVLFEIVLFEILLLFEIVLIFEIVLLLVCSCR